MSSRTKRPVGRPPLPGRRTEILRVATRVAAERGIDTLTLAELAGALGCSTYTLTYHFGRKEQLLTAIVEHAETELREEIQRLAADPGTSPGQLLRRYWRATREPGARDYLRLWLELLVLSSRHPERFPGFQERAALGWRHLAGDILRERTGSDELATLIIAAVTGLELELLLGPHPSGADQALERLARLLDDQLATDRPRPSRPGDQASGP
ncbi:TetR/AcrR family transcriptional regulator [Nonomuraea lactucae]|uniref:TetR/AcrR family transcriptional regulator n=1 Tax=Nonomuraea lactucae TaxID=2249762 RepID=UPI000DE1DFC8|nr:TetR/AcrR family transcriptional regulator [Nonomuraea lactucae]